MLLDLLGADAQVLLVEPRRMRDRAADLLAEEADLAGTLAKTWGATAAGEDHGFPRLHLPFDRLLAHTDAPRRGRSPPRPRGARRRHRRLHGILRHRGRRPERAPRQRRRRQRQRATATGSWWPPTARRRPAACDELLAATASTPRWIVVRAARAGLHPARRQAGRARRARPHRPAPGPPPARPRARRPGLLRRPQGRRLRRAPPARRGPLRRHGQAGHRRRRARLPAARVPGRRQALRAVRPDRRRAPLHRRRVARASTGSAATDWQKTKAKVRSAVSEIAQELVVLYQKRLHTPGPRLPRRHPVAARAGGRLPVPGDARPAQGHQRREGRHGGRAPDGPPRVRRRRLRQDRGGDPGRVQGGAGRQAGGGAGAHHAAGPAALPDVLRPLRRLPGAGRGAVAVPHAGARRRWSPRACERRGRRRDRHPPPAVRRHHVQGPRPARGRRGAALRREPTRSRSSSSRPTSTCSR